MSSSFGGSTFTYDSFDNNTDLVHQKKTSLLDKVIQKRSDLGFSSANLTGRNVEALDADTVRINPSVADKAFDPMVKPVDIRLKSNNFGESFNSYEVNHGNESDPEVAARLSKQRDTIDNELLHGWFNPATNQDVYDRGEKAKQILSNKLKAVNEGKTGLDFALSGKDEFGRELGDMKLSNEDTSIIDNMNTPEMNSAYNTPYNFAKTNQDNSFIDHAKDTLSSLGTGATVLAGQGLVGMADLAQYGVKKALTVGEDDNSDLVRSINDAPSITDQLQTIGYDPTRTKTILDEALHSKEWIKKEAELQNVVSNSTDEWDAAKNTASWLANNPTHLVTGSVAESLPMMVGGMGVTKAVSQNLAKKTLENALRNTSKDNLKILGAGALTEGLQSAGMIADNADLHGRTQDEYAPNALLAGLATGVINMGMNSSFGDIATSIATRGAIKPTGIVKSMLSEGAEEAQQTALETINTNIAEGEDNIYKGIGSETVLGTAAGMATGGGMATPHSAINALQATKSPVDTQTPTKENIVQPETNLKPSIADYEASVDNITDDNRQEVINQGIKDFPVNGTLAEKQQMANAIGKALNGEQSTEFKTIAASVFAETTLQNVVAQMNKDNPTGFSDVINNPNTTIEDIQDSIITATPDSVSTNTGSLFNDIGRTKDPETLDILKGISIAKQKEYAESNTVNDPYVLATTGIETKYLPKESSEVFSSITRDEYTDLNQGLNLLSAHVKSATTPEQKNTGISALTKTISKVYSDKVDITPATEKTVKQALNTINGLVTNKGTITIEPSDSLEDIHRKILPTFGSQPIENKGNEKANELVKANNNLLTALKSTSDVSRDKLDGKGLLPSYREHLQLINILIANNAPKNVIDARVNKLAKWVEYDKGRNALFQKLINNPQNKDSIEQELKTYQQGNPFTDNKHLVYTSGSETLAKELANESKIMSDALQDIQNQINGKSIVSTSQTDENALYSTNVSVEQIVKDYLDKTFKNVNPKLAKALSDIIKTNTDNVNLELDVEKFLHGFNKGVGLETDPMYQKGLLARNTTQGKKLQLINKASKPSKSKESFYDTHTLLQVIAKLGGLTEESVSEISDKGKSGRWFKKANTKSKVQPMALQEMVEALQAVHFSQITDSKELIKYIENELRGVSTDLARSDRGHELYAEQKLSDEFDFQTQQHILKVEQLLNDLENTPWLLEVLNKLGNKEDIDLDYYQDLINENNSRTEETSRTGSTEEIPTEATSTVVESSTSNETNKSEEVITSEDKASIIEDLTPTKQEFTPEYQKEVQEFKLANITKLKKGILSLKPVKRTIPNPIAQMFSFDKVKDSLFGKYPRLFENLFNLPEFTVNTKDGLKAFETLKKEETKFQEAFKKSYLEKPFEDDPLIVLANQNVANGKFDPNIVSAMFMGSIDWLMNKGSDTLFNFEKDIQSILSMDENTIPQNEISNTLSELGSVRAVVATGLGNNIFNLMKFTASKTYPENEIAKLKLSLGLHALNTLNNMGYVTYSAVENSTFDKFKQNEVVNPQVKGNLKPSELQDQSVVFVRIASDVEDKKSVIEYDLKQVLDTLKAGNKEITAMFESAYEKELPRTKKPNKASILASLGFNEEKGKKATGLHTTQEITSERVDALTEYVQIPHTLETPTMKLYLAMSEDARAEMELGVDFQEQKQQSKERSFRGKVLSYEKEKEALEKLLELSEQGSKPLYFMSTFWNQGRIGGIGVGHPQNNKWIRNLSSPKNYFVKIKPSDEFAVTQFKLAVLEAFGIAAKSLTKEQINPKFQEILEANQKAIDEINKQKEGKEFNQRTIINAVHKGKEKAHTLNGLVALSMYSATEEFETNIGREVDGITNGVLIGLVLLAGVDNFERMKDVLAAAGLFEDPTMDYATWKNSVESKEDNYEQIARVFAKSLNQADQTLQLLAIKHFIGDLLVDDKVTSAGRKFAKPILLLTMFGKSTDKLANSVGDTVIATFYDELEKLFRDTDLQPEEKEVKLEVLKKQVETILNKPLQGNEYVEGKVVRGEDNKASVVNLTMNNLLEFSLTQQDANSIIATVNHLFQPMIEEAINHNFGVTIANRKILNDAYFVVGEVFKLGLQKELLRFQYEQYIKLHPDNLHPTRKQLEHFRANEGKEPSAEQMDKIIADLIKIQPRSPTKNSESLEQDLQLWNSERSSNHTAAYKTQTGWNSKTGKLTYQIADEDGRIFTQELDLPKSTSAHALSLIVNSLGVGVTIANIHNRDSNVMIDMMKSKFKGLAVHDAFIFNLLEAVEGSKLLNSSLIDSLNSFDVFQGAINNLERVQEYLKANPDILSKLNSSFISPTQGLFSKQRFYTKDKKTKKIIPHYNNLDNFVERLKANQETLATQRQEQIWDHIPKGGVKQYGGQDSYEFTKETETKPSDSNKEEVKPSTTQVGFKLVDREGKALSPQQNSKDQKKANIATHMIGFGRDKPNRKSTTIKYQEAAVAQGIPLNAGKYTKDSVAFVSVSGSNAATNHDIKNTVDEALKVLNMNGSIVMDNKTNRESSWNISGEGRVFQQIVKAVGKEDIVNISKDSDYVQLQLKSKKTNNEALASDYWFDSTDEERSIEEFKQQFADANSGKIIFKYFDENRTEVTDQDSPFKVAGYAIINEDKAKSLLTKFGYKGSLEDFLTESEQENFIKGSDKEKLITALYTDTSTTQTNKDNKPLGSTPNAEDLFKDTITAKKDLVISGENIVSEFDAMPKGDDETHNTFLRNFVSQVIAPVVEATELLLFSKATYTYGQYSAELKKVAINLGQALQEQYSPFKMSAQEVFAHEFSHAVTWAAYQMSKNGTLKRKIDSLFYAVRREFNKAKVLDPSLAIWDYVFNNTDPIKVDNAPNSLGEVTTTSYDRGIQEFIAFGTTNKEFRDLIKRLQPKQLKVNQVYEGTGSDVIKEASWLETITNVFKRVLDSFMKIAKGNDYLEPLTQFDTNVRLILAANTDKPFVNITAITDKVEAEVAKKTNEGFKKGLKIIAKGRNSKIEVIRSAAILADAIPAIGGFQTNQVIRQTLKLITNPTARQFALDLVKDIADVNENSKPIVNVNLQQRTADADRNKATDSDENNWSKRVTLNHEQDIAYNNVLVRGDYESLNDAYGDDAIKLLKDKSFRDKQIKLIGDQISNLKSKSLNLANLMVHGKNMFNGMTEHNAVLIAKQGRNIPQDKYQKEIDLVTKLSRLYAIGLQDENQLNQVISLLESNPDGMKKMLMVHKELKKQQLTEIAALTVVDGQPHTTLDPNKRIFLGTKEDEKHLVSDWKAKIIGKLERDPNDPLSTEGFLYFVDVKMQNDWDAKAMATTDITPGSSNFQSGIVKTERFKAAENREKAKLKEDGTKTKNHIFTRNNSNVSRVAIHNAQGKIIRYEYILDRETQEKYLNPGVHVLRDLAAQKNGTAYRYKAYELNHKLVDALYDYWKRLGHAAKKDMIWVGTDSKYKDLYNTIPTETKEYITKVFGTENGFYMAEEELREVFGYRKQSITNWIQPVQADELKKTMGNMIYEQAKRFGLNQANIKALETMWIEGIAIAKDTIVVKSGVVSAANESSNFMTAKLAGVPFGFYYKNKISAMKAEQQYRRDSHAYLSHLSNAYGNPDYITKEIAAEMKILETALSQNEMSYLHDEGLASTVAEEGSYKDKHQTMLYNKTERARNIFDKLPKVVKDTLKVTSISEGTKIYKLLDEIAQMGDITSRHVLVKWEEEKARQQGKTFDKNKAIDLAKFLFIQYHTVTNDLVQYGNDIGLLMFTKFAVKALKVLTYMVGHHPARLIALGLFEEMFTTTNWIWDTSLNKVANPIASMMAAIDASLVINFTLTPPAYMDDRVFGALDAVLPI